MNCPERPGRDPAGEDLNAVDVDLQHDHVRVGKTIGIRRIREHLRARGRPAR
jgi:hypothetical protein